jgi:molybdopterin-guanine dinucleotide biosynthesis protein A
MPLVDYYGKIDNGVLCNFGGNIPISLNVSCIILAGGKSTRLGRNKIIETIGSQSLLERVVSTLLTFERQIIVVAAKDSYLPQLTNIPGYKTVMDIYPGRGSLGGLFTGLVYSKTLHNLVVACDMPFLKKELIQFMIGRARGFDVVVPKICGVYEPLHGIYSRNCIDKLEELIKRNRFSILELYPLVKVKQIENAEIDLYDPQHLSFFNINTEADLKRGIELVRRGDVKRDKC